LISVLSELIQAVQGMLAEQEIQAPLMVVKGDGSLVDAAFALEYPIETILSGPAASVVGSLYLSGRQDACVVDMGGTTTDIALVQGGKPILNRDGATVGGFFNDTATTEIYTYGLGGDSEVRIEDSGRIDLGPRRLIPLSLLVQENPLVLDDLERQMDRRTPGPYAGRYVVVQRAWKDRRGELSESQRRILLRLEGDHPVALYSLFQGVDSQFLMETELKRLTNLGYVAISGFTPTDAAHVLGLHDSWSREAATLGAELTLRSFPSLRAEDLSAEQLCADVLRRVALQSGRAVVTAVLAEGFNLHLESFPAFGELFVDRAIESQRSGATVAGMPAAGTPAARTPAGGDLFGVSLSLKRPLVAIGAPVTTYYPDVAESLHTELVIPSHAEVANAVGAVVGSVMQSVQVLISPQNGGELFRVHCEDGVHDFHGLEEAASFALEAAKVLAEGLARKAGASSVKVLVDREDHNAVAAGEDFFVQSLITATATGRPHLAHDESVA
jgi:N-methylhydantoinase A/oxoprolinase/acetone carboxylase beta subunit